MDGTREKDPWGNDIATYDSEHIVNFARVWTGLHLQNARKNIEQSGFRGYMHNYVDPMKIKPAYRDIFPKPDLDGNFIGDHYPVCTQLPSRPYLRKGASYRYTGNSATEHSNCENRGTGCLRLTPNTTTSALYQHLCSRPSAGAACSFPSSVVLPSKLACDGQECEVDDITVLKVAAVCPPSLTLTPSPNH